MIMKLERWEDKSLKRSEKKGKPWVSTLVPVISVQKELKTNSLITEQNKQQTNQFLIKLKRFYEKQ